MIRQVALLFLLVSCGQVAEPSVPSEPEETVPSPETSGVSVREELVQRQREVRRRLDSMEGAAEGRPADIRSIWSVTMRHLRSSWNELDGAIDAFDPGSEGWMEAGREIGARVDAFDEQLDGELGALERER